MYVCLCGDVSEDDIRAAIAAGVNSYDDLCTQLGVAKQCKGCDHNARTLFNQLIGPITH